MNLFWVFLKIQRDTRYRQNETSFKEEEEIEIENYTSKTTKTTKVLFHFNAN